MGKKISIVIATALALCVLLVSCGGGGGGGGGGGSTTTSSSGIFTGSFTVNGGSYSSLAGTGNSSGTATLSGSSGTLNGTYTLGRSAEEIYTITFPGGTIIATFSGNTVTLSNGTWTASGTGTLQGQTSSGGTGTQCPEALEMTAEELAVYNSLLGTKWKRVNSIYNEMITINRDGTVVHVDYDNDYTTFYDCSYVTSTSYTNDPFKFECYTSDNCNYWAHRASRIHNENGSWVYGETDDYPWIKQ